MNLMLFNGIQEATIHYISRGDDSIDIFHIYLCDKILFCVITKDMNSDVES